MDLHAINIDKALNCRKHIENSYHTAQYKLHASRRIRKYLTLDKTILLDNAFCDGPVQLCSKSVQQWTFNMDVLP